MKIHHLNCETLKAPFVQINTIVYCLLVETSQGLVLIDTGFGSRDYTHPAQKMRFFLRWMSVPKLQEETALAQVQSLGFDAGEVLNTSSRPIYTLTMRGDWLIFQRRMSMFFAMNIWQSRIHGG